MRVRQPEVRVTAVGDVTLELLGTWANPTLKAKAHETLTLVRWMAAFLPSVANAIPHGNVWRDAAQALVAMYDLMSNAAVVVPNETQQAYRIARWRSYMSM